MKLFDAHIHFSFEIPLERTVDIFRREFDMAGVSGGCFLSLPHHSTKDGSVDYKETQNVKALYLKRSFAPTFYAFAGLVHPSDYSDKKRIKESFLEQAKEYFSSGYDGIKMLEGYPNLLKARGIPLDDEIYDLFYAFMEENGYPILMHAANPIDNWDASKCDAYAVSMGRVYDATFPTKDAITEQVFSVMKKFPRLKLILAHMGFFSLEPHNAQRYLGDYENTMLDTTPGDEQWLNMSEKWDYWLEFLKKYRNRIIYGTDFYAFDDSDRDKWITSFMRRPKFLKQFFETDGEHTYIDKQFRGVNMPRDLLERIYSKNAHDLLGEPKPLSDEYIVRTAERLLLMENKQSAYANEDLKYILENIM